MIDEYEDVRSNMLSTYNISNISNIMTIIIGRQK